MLSYILLVFTIVFFVLFIVGMMSSRFEEELSLLFLIIAFGCFVFADLTPTSVITNEIEISKMPNVSYYYETNTDKSNFTYFDKELKTVETVGISKENIKIVYKDELNHPYISMELNCYIFGEDEPIGATVYLDSKELKE